MLQRFEELFEKYPRRCIAAFIYLWPILVITLLVLIGGSALGAVLMPVGLVFFLVTLYVPPLVALGYAPAVQQHGVGGFIVFAFGYIVSGTVLFYFYALILWVLVHGPIII